MSKTDENATKTVKKSSTRAKWDKKDPRGPRPSPTASASEYEEGTIMMGNDGTNYIVKVVNGKNGQQHRWVKHKLVEIKYEVVKLRLTSNRSRGESCG
eukprot:scaffold25098_cov64-Cyclotella_meneghiniana.AAC.2